MVVAIWPLTYIFLVLLFDLNETWSVSLIYKGVHVLVDFEMILGLRITLSFALDKKPEEYQWEASRWASIRLQRVAMCY